MIDQPQCVIIMLLSGDTIIGMLKKDSKQTITLTNPIRLGDLSSSSERIFGFNRHNIFGKFYGKQSNVIYNKHAITTMYPVHDNVVALYEKMVMYLEKYLEPNIRKETNTHIGLIDNALNPPNLSNEMLKKFQQMMEQSFSEQATQDNSQENTKDNDTTLPPTNKKKTTVH